MSGCLVTILSILLVNSNHINIAYATTHHVLTTTTYKKNSYREEFSEKNLSTTISIKKTKRLISNINKSQVSLEKTYFSLGGSKQNTIAFERSGSVQGLIKVAEDFYVR